jgi:hypothetical protein
MDKPFRLWYRGAIFTSSKIFKGVNKHSTKEERQKSFNFYCEKCDFGCFVEILYTRHLETKKHNNN